MHTKVHTIYLHVFPELQLQHALLVFEFQLSRPARETSISWALSVVTLYVIMRTDNKRHLTVKKDWLLALWGQPVTAVFWCEICSVYHVTCIQMLCCITCMTRQTFTLYEIKNEPVRLQTYATMSSDSSETNAFFSWTSWIHCSIISGEPLRSARKKWCIFSLRKQEDVFFWEGWVLNKVVRRNQIYLRHLTQHPCECLSTSPHANLHKDSKRL